MDSLRVSKMVSDQKIEDIHIDYYPALKIGRLAVDKRYEKKGIGTYLLHSVIGKALLLSLDLGCRYITVNAKRNAIPFYERNGFLMLKRQEKRREPTMSLDLFPIKNKLLY